MRTRRGAALVLALLAITLIGALVAAAQLAVFGEARLSGDGLLLQRALAAAERGVENAVEHWDKQANLSVAPGALARTDTITDADGSVTIVRITRLTASTFAVAADARAGGRSGGPTSRRRVSVLLRLAIPRIDARAAFTTRGALAVTGSARVDGHDAPPDDWPAGTPCPPASPRPAIALPDTARLCVGACGVEPVAGARIDGEPSAARSDILARDSLSYTRFGAVSYASLTRLADVVLTAGARASPRPSTRGGQCAIDDPANWGDPSLASACRAHLPIVWAQGDLELAPGARGQGLLLVDGDLRLDDDARYDGVLIVQGKVIASGRDARVHGVVMAATTDRSVIGGEAGIRYSSCVVARTVVGAAPVARVAMRSWAEVF